MRDGGRRCAAAARSLGSRALTFSIFFCSSFRFFASRLRFFVFLFALMMACTVSTYSMSRFSFIHQSDLSTSSFLCATCKSSRSCQSVCHNSWSFPVRSANSYTSFLQSGQMTLVSTACLREAMAWPLASE
jgi:hypothetical protein